MASSFDSILKSLANRDLILPYFEAAIVSERWPDKYIIEVDSSPYYGAGDGYFHPSTHPLMGERQLYYHFHPDTRDKMIKERPHLKREMFLSIGSAVHSVLQTQMQMCGLIKNPETDIEREYVNHEHHVRGRIDWVVTHPNGAIIPVEFKTQNTWDFRRQEQPKAEWLAQLNLGMDSMDADFGIVLTAERGGNFDMAEFHVNRDRELLDGIYGKFDRVREAIATNTPPRHCCALESQQMHDCPARYECWLKKV
jgi:hypothetical protein